MEPSMFLVAAREVMKQKGLVPRDLIKMGARSRNRIYDWLGGRAEMKESGLADLMKGLGIGLVVGEEAQALENFKQLVQPSKAAAKQGMKMLAKHDPASVRDVRRGIRKRKLIGKWNLKSSKKAHRKPRKSAKRKSAKRTRGKRR